MGSQTIKRRQDFRTILGFTHRIKFEISPSLTQSLSAFRQSKKKKITSQLSTAISIRKPCAVRVFFLISVCESYIYTNIIRAFIAVKSRSHFQNHKHHTSHLQKNKSDFPDTTTNLQLSFPLSLRFILLPSNPSAPKGSFEKKKKNGP